MSSPLLTASEILPLLSGATLLTELLQSPFLISGGHVPLREVSAPGHSSHDGERY